MEPKWAERVLCRLCVLKTQLCVLRGGAGTSMLGMHYFFNAETTPAATILPRLLHGSPGEGAGGGSVFRIVFAGLTDAQKERARRYYEVRREVVEQLLAFYQRANPYYANVRIGRSTRFNRPVRFDEFDDVDWDVAHLDMPCVDEHDDSEDEDEDGEPVADEFSVASSRSDALEVDDLP